MKKVSYLILGSVIIPIAFSSVPAVAEMNSNFSPKLQLQGDWTSDDNSYGLGVLLPYTNQLTGVPFLDLRYYQNDNNISNASIGLGYRHSLPEQKFFGINSYYDTIETDDNKYTQASVGIEYITKAWEARANYYQPTNDDKNILNELFTAGIKDNYLGINTTSGIEELNNSADLEFGRILSQDKNSSLKMYIGGFWQERTTQDDNVGFRLKSEYDTSAPNWLPKNTALGFGLYVEHDDEDELRVGAQLKLNLGVTDNSNNHILQQVRRELIMTPDVYNIDTFEQAANYGKIQKFAYDNTNEDIQAVNGQIANLGENGVALMSGTVTFDNSLIIGEGQTLLGNGSLLIKTLSGKQAEYRQTTPAKINNTSGDSSVVKVASNSTVTGIMTKGGAEGIGSLNESTNNVSINNVDISATTGDGIKLNNTNGLNIKNSKIHDLNICENNTDCEFAVFSPTKAPNSAVSAIGSQNINIDNVKIDDVTYGIFLASDYDQETSTYKTTTSNVNINNTSISNTRLEGLLLVGNDNVTIDNLTIDNSNQDQEMDLIVLQGSHNITMNETNLSGGINGLMIVNSSNLPSFDDNNIKIKNMNINNTSRSGVFINPASKIELENVTVNNPGIAGIALYGNEWMGGAVEDVSIKNLQINNPSENAVVFFGPVKNIKGDINTNQNENTCSNLWDMAKFEQEPGSTLTINGNKIANLSDCN